VVDSKEEDGSLSWRMIQILDDVNSIMASMEGTESVLMTMDEAFRFSSRTLEEFKGSVCAVRELVKRHVEQLACVGKKIDTLIKEVD